MREGPAPCPRFRPCSSYHIYKPLHLDANKDRLYLWPMVRKPRVRFALPLYAAMACMAWGGLTLWATRALAATDPLLETLTGTSPEFVVTTWRMQQGLPSDRVRAVLQTRDGYVWVATFNGAAQFDGVRFRVFNDANTPALRNSLVNCLFFFQAEDGIRDA